MGEDFAVVDDDADEPPPRPLSKGCPDPPAGAVRLPEDCEAQEAQLEESGDVLRDIRPTLPPETCLLYPPALPPETCRSEEAQSERI